MWMYRLQDCVFDNDSSANSGEDVDDNSQPGSEDGEILLFFTACAQSRTLIWRPCLSPQISEQATVIERQF